MIPDAESEKKCVRIIQYLADKYQSVPFQPHITAAGVPDWSEEKVKQAVERIAGSTSQFKIRAKKVHCKSPPYQKLTLEVEKTAELHELHQRTDRGFKGDYSKKEYPHLSFLYSTIPCAELRYELKKVGNESLREINVKELALVRCKGTPEEWRTLYVWKLKENKSLI